MKKWYYVDNGQKYGPVTIEYLGDKISKETLVWREGMKDWKKAIEIIEVSSIFTETPPPIPGTAEIKEVNSKHISRIKEGVYSSWLYLFATIAMGVMEYAGEESKRLYGFAVIVCITALVRVLLALKSYLSYKLNYTKINRNLNWIIGLLIPLYLIIGLGARFDFFDRMSESASSLILIIGLLVFIPFMYHTIMLAFKLLKVDDSKLTAIKIYAMLNAFVFILQIGVYMSIPESEIESSFASFDILFIIIDTLPIAFLIYGMREIKQKCVEG